MICSVLDKRVYKLYKKINSTAKKQSADNLTSEFNQRWQRNISKHNNDLFYDIKNYSNNKHLIKYCEL